MSATVDQGAEARRARLAALLTQRAAAPRDTPLSDGQTMLWHLSQLAGDAPVYNVPAAWRLGAPVAPDLLARAAAVLTARHEVLRAGFPSVDGEPVQRTVPATGAPVPFEHVTVATEAALRDALDARARAPFDMAAGPLWRLSLIETAGGAQVLALVMHHIIADGMAFQILLRELDALVTAFAAGQDDPLDPPGMAYSAWAARERAARDGSGWTAQVDHWRTRFATPAEPLVMPFDGTAPQDARACGQHLFSAGEGLPQAVADLGRAAGATPFMVLLAGFAAMLHRATGQREIVLCAPVAGRRRSGARAVVGYCNNILPLRLDLSGAPSFRELLARVRAEVLDAHRAQDVPLKQIAQAPGLARTPLRRLVFSYEEPWPPAFGLAGVPASRVPLEAGAADFDLAVILYEEGGQLNGSFRHRTGVVSATRAAALSDGFARVLAAALAAPDAPVAVLPAPDTGPPPTGADATAGGEAPRYPLEQKLAAIWADVLGMERTPRDVDFAALGASSLAVARIAERIAAEHGVDLPLPRLFSAGTVAQVAALLEDSSEPGIWDPLAPIRTGGDGVPLILVDGIGIYYDLASALPAGRPVWGLVRAHTQAADSVTEAARGYADRLLEAFPQGPLALGGLSGGGLVAFEVARRLRAAGRDVPLVALFDSPAPGAFTPHGRVRRMLGHAGNLLRRGPSYVAEKRAARAVGAAGSAAAAIADHAGLRAAFSAAVEAHELRPLDVPVMLFRVAIARGATDTLFDPALGRIDPYLGWGSAATGGLEIVDVAGGHVDIMAQPRVAHIAQILAARLP